MYTKKELMDNVAFQVGGFTSVDECLEFVRSEYKRIKNIQLEVEEA